MADDYEARDFVGNPTPPPDFSKAQTPKAAPAPATGIPLTAKGLEGMARAPSAAAVADAPDESPVEYTAVNRRDGSLRLFMTDKAGESTDLGELPQDTVPILNQSGQYDETTQSWVLPPDVAQSLQKGERALPDFWRQQYVTGDASVIRGLWGDNALRGAAMFETAKNHGDIERLKMVVNEKPSQAWGEAPFGRTVAEMRWASGEAAKLPAFIKGVAGESAMGAAVLGGAALAMTVAAGIAPPVAIPMVAGMMAVGGRYGVFTYTARVEGGNIALDMYDKGFDPRTIRQVAPIAGAISGILELTGMKYLIAPWRRGFVTKVLASGPVQKAMVKWYVSYAKELGAEVSVEVAQEIVALMSNDFAALVDKRPELLNTKEEVWAALLATAVQATAGLAVVKIPGAVTEGGLNIRGQRAKVRELKAAVAAGELKPETITAKMIATVGEEGPEPLVIKAVNDIDTLEGKDALEFGRRESGNENVKAALHAKVEALKMQKAAIDEGVKAGETFPEDLQTDVVRITTDIGKVNQIAAGMEEGMKLSAEKRVEPMVPLKEPRTPAEAAERRYTEQEAVLKTLAKESAALDKELTNLHDEQTARLAETPQKSVVAINAAMDKIAAKIRENDAKGAEIVMTPLHAEENLAMDLMDSNATATISAAELIRMERDLVDKVAAAKESGRTHGEAYAKREVQRVQHYIQELVKRSGMTDAQKSKFISVLRSTQTVEQLEKNYPEIRDRIFEAEDTTRQKAIAALLKKGLKSGKVKRVSGKPMGRFGDADTQNIVNDIQKIVKMTRTDAALLAPDMELALLDAEGPVEKARAEYRYRAALYRAGHLSTKEGAAFVTDLVGMMEGAKAKYLERKLAEEAAWQERKKERVRLMLGPDTELPADLGKRVIEDGELVKGWHIPRVVLGLLEQGVSSMESLGHLLGFRSGQRQGESAVDRLFYAGDETRREGAIQTEWADKENAAEDRAYGFTGTDSQRATARRKNRARMFQVHDLGTHKNATGQDVSLKDYTIARAMNWAELKSDPTLDRNLTDPEALAYTPAMEKEIAAILTDGDRRMVAERLQLYRDLYAEVNPIVRKQRGVDLPFNPNYSPVSVINPRVKPGAELSPDSTVYQVHPRSTMGGWGISRVTHLKSLNIRDSFAVWEDHVQQIAHYMAWEAKVREWNRFLADSEVRAAIIGLYGRGVLTAAQTMTQRLTAGGHERAIMAGANRFISRLVTSNVLFKPIMIAKQFSTVPAFTLAVPVQDLHKFVGYSLVWMKEGFSKEWANSDFVKARGWNQTPELAALHKYAQTGNPLDSPRMIEAGASFFKQGDMASIMVGGDALFRYLRSTGKSVAEALVVTSDIARTTQSSGQLSEQSVLQGTTGWARLFTAYLNQPIQFLRIELDVFQAIASKGFSKGEGRMTRGEAIKTLFIVHFVLPMLFQSVADWGWDSEKQLRAAILGNFNTLPAWSNMLSNIYDKLAKTEGARFGLGTVLDSWQRDVYKALKSLSEVEDPQDFINAILLLSDPAFKAIWGIPTKPFINVGTAAKKVSVGGEDNYTDAFKLVAGYSPFAVEEQRRKD